MTPFEYLVESLSVSGITDEDTVRAIALARNIVLDDQPSFNGAPVVPEITIEAKAAVIAEEQAKDAE